MLPDTETNPAPPQEPQPEIEPIGVEQAQQILQTAMDPYLADGWRVIDRSAFTARLTREMRNLDIRVDLLGEVETEEMGLTPLQESGRLMAWALLLASLLVMLALASALGIV
ncbi:MAG: hypothetical protein JXJ20_09715 [Anaerolineae bacterium]|jgi:hypothetical protein|nr:hypothetical protein [Anaerolineae bacterium]